MPFTSAYLPIVLLPRFVTPRSTLSCREQYSVPSVSSCCCSMSGMFRFPIGGGRGESNRESRRTTRSLDDKCGDHAEHTRRSLGVRQDVAVERPDAGFLARDHGIP